MAQLTAKQKRLIKKTEDFVRGRLAGEATGHDWLHACRVRKTALKLAETEGPVDLFVISLASLLHDVADWKFCGGDVNVGATLAVEWLTGIGVDVETQKHVRDIIANISFKGSKIERGMKTREGMIVQDADRLDAMGAIGIARAFALGEYFGRSLYDPKVRPVKRKSFKAYQPGQGTTISHFYDKLLFLKDLLNTETARKMAAKRHRFMELFLKEFFAELDEPRQSTETRP
jgi:uncharacterized protein